MPITPGRMSIESVTERVAAIHAAIADPATLAETGVGAASGGTEAPSGSGQASFAAALALAQSGSPQTAGGAEASGSGLATVYPAGLPAYAGTANGVAAGAGVATPAAVGAYGQSIGQRIVAVAESQAGQTEQPPGSNESPAIAAYRGATVGSTPGAPWCAYFASWAARQAGEPIGSEGQGLGSVSAIWSWAQSTGRAIPNGPGVLPKPGDLIVFGDEHVGIVRGVLPNGKIATVEGNYENRVALNERPASEATGYVEMS